MKLKKAVIILSLFIFFAIFNEMIPVLLLFSTGYFFIKTFIFTIKKDNAKTKKAIIQTVASFILMIITILFFIPTSSETVSSEKKDSTKETKTSFTSSESTTQTSSSEYHPNYEQLKKEQTDYIANLTYENEIQTLNINNEQPIFTDEELSIDRGSWIKFGALDELGRATFAEAMLNKDMIPTKKRKAITIDPSGWNNKKIKSGYLYNRTHLIGYKLSGENNNERNLVTATRQLNNPEMLRFEMDIATYLEKDKEHYVRYSVVPFYQKEDLVPQGIHLQAQSINDDAIKFNVYIFNVQNHVKINYTDGSSKVSEKESITAESTPPLSSEVASSSASSSRVTPDSSNPSVSTNNSNQTHNLPEESYSEPVQQVVQPPQEEPSQQTVFITATGTKYHFDSNCRGLNNANGLTEVSLATAQASYTLCGWED